jgi:enediyne polyketide synthase
MTGIAIVGIGCRYPEADSPTELWDNVLAQRRSFRRLPAERLSLEDYFSPDPKTPDATYADQAALLEDWEFDRVGYTITGPAFRATDLTHWLALDVAQRTLDDAGFEELPGIDRDRVAVIVGNTLTGEFSRSSVLRLRWPYVRRTLAATLERAGLDEATRARIVAELEHDYKAPFAPIGEESLAGALSNTIAGRICSRFDFHGGGYSVDGACASSLLAVINGCTALLGGDADLVLAGGVDLSIDPFELVGFAKTGALAADLMRVYDRRSAGFWPGEGCGFLALARLEDARSWGTPISGVIRGWGISSDGRGGVTRPEAAGQLLALERAYARARWPVDSVGLFEGHGTGTAVGDGAEIEALARAVGPSAPIAPALSSIKANIGHTKAAAGVAGVIKATLALGQELLPPITGCEAPHELLEGPGAALRILREPEAWPAERPLRAGVSAMGFGGINTHLAIESVAARRRPAVSPRVTRLARTAQDVELLPLAARSLPELAAHARELAANVRQMSFGQLRDLGIQTCRQPGDERARGGVVASSPRDAARRLETLADAVDSGEPQNLDARRGALFGTAAAAPRVGFLFPPQAAPIYVDGGALARRFPAARRVLALAALHDERAVLTTRVAQPAIAACSAAAVAVLEELGAEAEIGLGHSLGELAALAWAGALSTEELIELARLRGRAMDDCPGEGSMVELAADRQAVAALIDGLPVELAAHNAPARIVVSGPRTAVEHLAERARGRGVSAVRLPVSHAFHSSLMQPAAQALSGAVGALRYGATRRAVLSTVTGEALRPGQDLRELLVRQLTSPVRFTDALGAGADAIDLWIEAGPGHILTDLARQAGAHAIATDAGGDSLACLLSALAGCWVLGADVDLARLSEQRVQRLADPLRRPTFLANPCEQAPALQDAPGPAEDHAATAQAATTGAELDAATPLEAVRLLVARRSELPLETITDDARLLTDLNLNSIAVGEIAATVAQHLGVRPPVAPTDLADATVAALAQVLAESEPDDGTAQGPPPGVASWVRPFTVQWRPRALRPVDAPRCDWTVAAPDGAPDAARLREVFTAHPQGEPAIVVAPAPERTIDTAVWLLDVVREIAAERRWSRVALLHAGHAGSVGRTLFLEHPDLTLRVAELPASTAGEQLRAARELAEWGTGFLEVRLAPDGSWLAPQLVRATLPTPAPGSSPLRASDVLLATGCGKGIGVEAALALAEGSGAALAILGRSDPARDDELRTNLERFERAGVRTVYERCDVARADDVRAAVAVVQRQLGAVTALLHAAGVNEPRRLAAIDAELVRSTLAPKVGGLAGVLAAVDRRALRLVVGFGSIIGRMGMHGEGHYALANEWLRLDVDELASAREAGRALTLEYSVWSGTGMGERLGRAEALARAGVMAIAPQDGTRLLQSALASDEAPSSLVACGRFGTPPTLPLEALQLPLTRFLERPLVHYPRTELIVECTLSQDTDPYLADHVIGGVPLLPAVVGLEAMAQVASALGDAPVTAIGELRLQRPITVPPDGRRVLRIAGLVQDDGRVAVAVRSEETGFDVDHFRAVCEFGPQREVEVAAGQGLTDRFDLQRELYGQLLFHGPRFQRVGVYRELSARQCEAVVATDPEASWFGAFLPRTLLLGDFGARDGFIHAAQACIPNRRVLPVAVDRIEFLAPLTGSVTMRATERWSDENELHYDLVVEDGDGRPLELWSGLVLRVLEPLHSPARWNHAVLAPYIERRVGELIRPNIRVALVNGTDSRAERRHAAAQRLSGCPAPIRHHADGRPESDAAAAGVSFAHLASYTLAVCGDGQLACDIEVATERPSDIWRGMLGPERSRLAQRLADEAGEPLAVAASRLWVAGECLRKAGRPAGEPVVLDRRLDDGWVVLSAGGTPVAVTALNLSDVDKPVVLGVLAAPEAS